VVATNVGGIPECVRHEETGLLSRRADVTSLREALARLITDPGLRLTLGSAGQHLWRAQFTAATMAARTLEVDQRALSAN
jgi:glycosyltransferase involved in cell wall biosynthesis